MSIRKDQNKLKDYEKLIEIERKKTQNAEKRILKLKKEVENLQKLNSQNYSHINNIKHKKGKIQLNKNMSLPLYSQSSFEYKGKTSESENENANILINDLHNQVDKLNNDLNVNVNEMQSVGVIKINKNYSDEQRKNNNLNNQIKYYEKEGLNFNYLKNSNDISFKNENKLNNINLNNNSDIMNNKKNKIYSIPEEMNTYTLESRNMDDKSRYIYDNDAFDKMKGSDINYNFERGYMPNFNNNGDKNIAFDFSSNNINFSNYDKNNDINIKNK